MTSIVEGPFGPARKIEELGVAVLERMYMEKCGVPLDLRGKGISALQLYECEDTKVRFWRPAEAAGDERFYHELSARWDTYYRPWRWEYPKALALISPRDRLLEIGCGRGYFLKLTEDRVASAQGLEFNNEAISNKVTRWTIEARMIEDLAAAEPESFDFVCSFQVLEHVVDPASFIEASIACLKPGGLLVYSTPNPAFGPHRRREDAFDLPPHHMSYFSHDTYRRIAKRYGMTIARIVDAPTFGAFRDPMEPYSFRTVVEDLRSAIDRTRGRSGVTTMVAMRKKA